MAYPNRTSQIFALTGSLLLSACDTANMPDPQAAAQMSLGDAKEIIQRSARWYGSDGASDHEAFSLQFTDQRLEFYLYRPDGTMHKLLVCTYENMRPRVGDPTNVGAGAHKGTTAYPPLFGCEDEGMQNWAPGDSATADGAKKTVDALQRWRISTMPERDEYFSQLQPRFAGVADAYRNQNPKPNIGEDVRRLQVIANAAVNEKRFADAADAYQDALKLAPWWPEGQFNAAVILGELHYYNEAIEHMRYYVALVPNASNARAAQDHIYAWEGELART
jgi:tetratricopeptide (TPR) repeat protein